MADIEKLVERSNRLDKTVAHVSSPSFLSIKDSQSKTSAAKNKFLFSDLVFIVGLYDVYYYCPSSLWGQTAIITRQQF